LAPAISPPLMSAISYAAAEAPLPLVLFSLPFFIFFDAA